MVINVIVNTNDSYKSFKDSNNWNQDLKIKGEILKYFSEKVPQLWTKATLLKTIKQLELQTCTKMFINPNSSFTFLKIFRQLRLHF